MTGPASSKRTLSPNQQRFVAEYLISGNATKAYLRAGYKVSDSVARRAAARLLTNVDIEAAVEAGMSKTLNRLEITRERVLSELARIAFSDKRRVMKWGPGGVSLRDSAELSDDDAAAVAEVSETTTATGGTLKLKNHDKVRALELLGRHLGMFTEKSGHSGLPLVTIRDLTGRKTSE